jgi:D-alanine-D-alanine ligase
MLEFALRSLRHQRKLQKLHVGVLLYLDEGRDCRYSEEIIRDAASRAGRVLILRPGTSDGKAIVERRGQRKYRLVVEGKPRRPGQVQKIPEALLWTCEKLGEISRLSSRKERLAVSATNVRTDAFPSLLPHRVTLDLMLSYLDAKKAERAEFAMGEIFKGRGFRCELELISDRPPMRERRHNLGLARKLASIAEKWEIPFSYDSSVAPSAGGLVPAKTPVVCGIGPMCKDRFTPQEAVHRGSLIQQTLLVAQYLADRVNEAQG